MATSKKQPETSTRRVWRMSANVPLGEFVDIASTAISSDSKADTPHRRATDAGGPPTSGAPDTRQRRRYEDAAAVPAMPAKMLKPAQTESWRGSSFDLLVGCRTRDVTDTIPDNVFDELFGKPEVQPPEKEGG